MPLGSAANTTSLLEMSSKFVFPVEDEVRSKIPLWMKFYCYEYSNTAAGRSIAYSRSGGGANVMGMSNEKAQILVPAPVNFLTQTSHNYGREETSAIYLFSNVYGTLLDVLKGLFPEKLTQEMGDIARAFEKTLDTVDIFAGNVTGNISEIPVDYTDTMYIGNGSSRTFEIRLILPCLTERDSKAAGGIVKAFEALSLPTARSTTFSLASTKAFHPPLWVFGIGPADSLKFDPDWSGSPQISVLRTVSHKKTSFDTNSLAAIGYNGLLKPVAYSITLLFQELEPAFRRTNPFGGVSTTITNRSGVIFGKGTSVTASVTGG